MLLLNTNTDLFGAIRLSLTLPPNLVMTEFPHFLYSVIPYQLPTPKLQHPLAPIRVKAAPWYVPAKTLTCQHKWPILIQTYIYTPAYHFARPGKLAEADRANTR